MTESQPFFPCAVLVPDSEKDIVSIQTMERMQTDIESAIVVGIEALWNSGGKEAASDVIRDIKEDLDKSE